MTHSTNNTEMQSEYNQSSRRPSRRHRSKEHKKSEKHVYYLFRNASDVKQWGRAVRSKLSIEDEQLEKELARSREVGKDAATIMNSLPATQLKHITKLQIEMNEQEESSRYEWRVASLWQEKPLPEFGNISQTMWLILKREKKEKKERASKPSSRHESRLDKLPELIHEELHQRFSQQYIPSQLQCHQSSYVQPGGIGSAYYYPAQPAVQEASSSPSIGGTPTYASSISSLDSTDTESHSSGYCSDAESISSNLTSGSTASSSSNTSIVTPPLQRAPLRSILRKPNQAGSEVAIHSDSASEASHNSEQDCRAVAQICYSGVNPNPSARSYIGTAPHAKRDFRRARKSGRLSEYQLETASTTTSSSMTRKTRFSDEASFCIAYDYHYESSESEEEVRYAREDKKSSRRRSEPGALAVSKYVQYGSD